MIRACNRGLIVAFAFFSGWFPANADDDLQARFRREAVTAWKSLRDFTSRSQWVVSRVSEPIQGYPDMKQVYVTETYKVLDENVLLRYQRQYEGDKGEEILWGINPDYAFRLDRSADKPWAVGFLDQDRDRVTRKIRDFGSELFVSTAIDEQDLAWTVEQPGFKINSLTPILRNDRNLVLLDFSSSAFEREDYQIRSGRVLLDPEHHWAVQEFEADLMLDQPATSTGRVVYVAGDDGFPVPLEYIQDFRATIPDIGEWQSRVTCKYKLENESIDESDFRLAAFGFTEPGIADSEGWPAWFWVVGFAVVCLAVAVFLKYRA